VVLAAEEPVVDTGRVRPGRVDPLCGRLGPRHVTLLCSTGPKRRTCEQCYTIMLRGGDCLRPPPCRVPPVPTRRRARPVGCSRRASPAGPDPSADPAVPLRPAPCGPGTVRLPATLAGPREGRCRRRPGPGPAPPGADGAV